MGNLTNVYSVATLAERWRCGTDTVYAMIRSGALPAFKLGGRLLRIRGADVDQYEAQPVATLHKTTPVQPTVSQRSDATDLRLERLIDRSPNATQAPRVALRCFNAPETKETVQ